MMDIGKYRFNFFSTFFNHPFERRAARVLLFFDQFLVLRSLVFFQRDLQLGFLSQHIFSTKKKQYPRNESQLVQNIHIIIFQKIKKKKLRIKIRVHFLVEQEFSMEFLMFGGGQTRVDRFPRQDQSVLMHVSRAISRHCHII